jgi:hypothetical protein
VWQVIQWIDTQISARITMKDGHNEKVEKKNTELHHFSTIHDHIFEIWGILCFGTESDRLTGLCTVLSVLKTQKSSECDHAQRLLHGNFFNINLKKALAN